MSFLLERLKILTQDELKKAFGYTMIVFLDDYFSLAVAQRAGKMFHIRPRDGAPAYEQRYDWVGPFCGAFAQAMENGRWFHIHNDGAPAYEQRYDWVGPFSGVSAEVKKDGEKFRIHTDGTRAD
jgi:hypothetical protein